MAEIKRTPSLRIPSLPSPKKRTSLEHLTDLLHVFKRLEDRADRMLAISRMATDPIEKKLGAGILMDKMKQSGVPVDPLYANESRRGYFDPLSMVLPLLDPSTPSTYYNKDVIEGILNRELHRRFRNKQPAVVKDVEQDSILGAIF